MSYPNQIYAFRNGCKAELTRSTEQFVVDAQKDVLIEKGFGRFEQASTTVNRVTVSSGMLEIAMAGARSIGPMRAYNISNTGQEFPVCDRIFFSFRADIDSSRIDALMARYALFGVKTYPGKTYLFRLTDRTPMDPVKLVRKLVEDEPIIRTADRNLSYRLCRSDILEPAPLQHLADWENRRGAPKDRDLVVGIVDGHRPSNGVRLISSEQVVGWAYWECYPGIDRPRLVTNDNLGANASNMSFTGLNIILPGLGVTGTRVNTRPAKTPTSGPRLLPIRFKGEGGFFFISDQVVYESLRYLDDEVDLSAKPWSSQIDNLFAPIVAGLICNLARSGGQKGKGLLFVRAAECQARPIYLDLPADVLNSHSTANRRSRKGTSVSPWTGSGYESFWPAPAAAARLRTRQRKSIVVPTCGKEVPMT